MRQEIGWIQILLGWTLLALGAIAWGLLSQQKQSLLVVVRGAKEGAWLPIVALLGCILFGALALAGAQAILSYAADKEAARLQEIEVVKEQLTQKRINDLEVFVGIHRRKSQYEERKRLNGDNTAIIFERTSEHGDLKSNDIEAYVVDKDINQIAFFVFHFFKNTAFWRFNEDFAFEDGNGRLLRFDKTLSNIAYVDEMRSFDMIVGVGLASHTASPVPRIAERRAAALCGLLFAKTLGAAQPKVYGLSLGQFTGSPIESREEPHRQQRSVLIVGARKMHENANERDLLEQILKVVTVPNVDFSLYSRLFRGESPEWVELQHCRKYHPST